MLIPAHAEPCVSVADQSTTACFSCPLSKGEHSPGLRAPTPPAGRCAPLLVERSFTAGLCAAVSPGGPVLPHRQPAVLLERLAGVLLSRASPGSRLRLPVAAAFFFLLRKRKVIPAGPRQGQASLRSVRTRTLDMTLSARIEEAREGGRKTQMPQQPAASRPGDAEHNV